MESVVKSGDAANKPLTHPHDKELVRIADHQSGVAVGLEGKEDVVVHKAVVEGIRILTLPVGRR